MHSGRTSKRAAVRVGRDAQREHRVVLRLQCSDYDTSRVSPLLPGRMSRFPQGAGRVGSSARETTW